MQRVDYLHGLIRVDVAVPGEAEGAERVTAHVPPLHREEQPPVVSKDRVVYDLIYTRAGGVRAALSIRCGHRAASFVSCAPQPVKVNITQMLSAAAAKARLFNITPLRR